MSTGLDATSIFTASVILWRWARRKSRLFSPISRSRAHVAAATQNQARSALLFLYREILDDRVALAGRRPAGEGVDAPAGRAHAQGSRERSRSSRRHAPADRCAALRIGHAHHGRRAAAREGRRIRARRNRRARRQGREGSHDDAAAQSRAALRAHLVDVRELHAQDLRDGFGATWLPNALQRKYPGAACDWGWQYVFPSRNISRDPRGGAVRRHHVSDQAFQRAMRQAVRDAGIVKPATPHTLAPFVRDAPARSRLRHPDRAGVIGSQRRQHDDDLHARPQPRRPRRRESARRKRPRAGR